MFGFVNVVGACLREGTRTAQGQAAGYTPAPKAKAKAGK